MNNNLFFFLYNLAHKSFFFDKLVIFTADIFPYIVIIVAGVFLLMHHEVFKAENPFQIFLQKKKEILLAFLTGVFAWVLAYVFKFLFSLSRPFDVFQTVHPLFPETGYAFPSGHATFFMALAISILFFHKKAGYLFVLFAFLIGIARIIAGVHFPVDILGGFVLGFLVALCIKFFL